MVPCTRPVFHRSLHGKHGVHPRNDLSTLALRRCVRKSVGLVAYIAILMIFHIFETLGSGGLVQMILSMISLWAMQGIIINRLWCMYRRSRLVITLLMTALFAEAASSIFVVALNFRLETRITELNSYRDMCFPTGFDTHFYVFWIFILAFDALIFTLAFLEAIKYIRESQARRALHQGSERSFLNSDSWPWVSRHGNFVQVLLRDSIVFPFITLVSCLLNILAWFQVLPYGWLQNTLNLSAVCSPILGCRLVLNLRELYYEPFAAEFRVSNRGEVPNSPRSPIDNSFELPVVFAKSRTQQSTDMDSIS
ncbi:hypothetical protein CC1G_07329 [Coprinopsis cinerea okayama7|uniref:Uncharacterized protein n=1 Tax=Coprinopsis cinerea (strain Okayama-7 / 130 / ATCC MYA-4618 / FGSC 9003) TaxID=240176 RepID=A8NNS1_COPC7|nr:hypothetical protein CC1G_07329 [Coprinopsis cinerea okayama7\|eukprot:XP_001835187.2 hypothetical protein CC1G_07329 [Coprinopsis cinerea okayama7\